MAQEQEIIERTFQVPAHSRLIIENIRGSVDVQPGEAGVIQVTAIKYLNSGDAQRTEVDIRQAGDGRVVVKTRHDSDGWIHFGWLFSFRSSRPCKVDYQVRVPPSLDLKVSGVTSSVSVQGIEGAIQLSTVSGPVDLDELSGDLGVSTVSGGINGEALSGALRLDTVSGRVRLEGCHFSSLDGSTVSGDLAIASPIADGLYRFKAVSGDVTLLVPGDTRCTLRSTSLSGRWRTDLPSVELSASDRGRTVAIQGGGTEIRHNSVSGEFRLLSSGAAPQSIAIQEDAEARQSQQRDVLERLARGELSAEEALSVLRS